MELGKPVQGRELAVCRDPSMTKRNEAYISMHRVDVPLQSLNLLFNVNHPVVSQVNPHVHIFFFSSRGSAGKPVAHHRGKG
jgi:hypothetical protein